MNSPLEAKLVGETQTVAQRDDYHDDYDNRSVHHAPRLVTTMPGVDGPTQFLKSYPVRRLFHSFRELLYRSAMPPLETLQQVFGYPSFRACQLDVINHIMAGRHAMVIMPTGMGKSLCYQIPALLEASPATTDQRAVAHPITLVLSPLIALMKDQVDALRARGVDAAYINSSLTRDQRNARYQEVAGGAHKLLYVTPERFRKPQFLEVISRRSVALLAVDEAHCISQWGHDFRPDYTRLAEFRRLLGLPTTIALTATATPEVQRDIVRQLGLQDDEIRLFHEGIDRPNLAWHVHEVWGMDDKVRHILNAVTSGIAASGSGSGIVYFTLIKTLEQFSDRLTAEGIPHVVYHGDLDRGRRRTIQDSFMAGKTPLVLATNAFGMGVDKENIRLVLHADLPGSLESYYQEIGRAGRDGQPSQCLLLYDERDLAVQMEFVTWSNPDADFYQRLYDLLTSRLEEVRAFGMEWLKVELCGKSGQDHRLDTALAMLERHDVIRGRLDLSQLRILSPLPPELVDTERLADKLRRDQKRLLALVQYVRHEGDRKAFVHDYFGLPYYSTL